MELFLSDHVWAGEQSGVFFEKSDILWISGYSGFVSPRRGTSNLKAREREMSVYF